MITFKEWLSEQRDFGLHEDVDEYLDWFVVASRHRDSDLLENCNWQEIEKALGDEHCAIFRFGHWAVGWTELMLSDSGEQVQNILEALADYPVFNDEAYSEMECEAAYEDWLSYGADNWLLYDSDDLRDDWKDIAWEYTRWESCSDGFIYEVDDFDTALLFC